MQHIFPDAFVAASAVFAAEIPVLDTVVTSLASQIGKVGGSVFILVAILAPRAVVALKYFPVTIFAEVTPCTVFQICCLAVVTSRSNNKLVPHI